MSKLEDACRALLSGKKYSSEHWLVERTMGCVALRYYQSSTYLIGYKDGRLLLCEDCVWPASHKNEVFVALNLPITATAEDNTYITPWGTWFCLKEDTDIAELMAPPV